jgi:hypothetical protein
LGIITRDREAKKDKNLLESSVLSGLRLKSVISPDEMNLIAFESLLLKLTYLYEANREIVDVVLVLFKDLFKISDEEYISIIQHLIVMESDPYFRWKTR